MERSRFRRPDAAEACGASFESPAVVMLIDRRCSLLGGQPNRHPTILSERGYFD